MRGGSKPGERRGGRKKGTRNKATAEIQDLARVYAPVAIAALAKIAKSGKSESAVVSAAAVLLDRGFGKAPQAVQHSGQLSHRHDLSKLTDEQIDTLEGIVGAASFAVSDPGGEGEAGG